MVFNIPSNPNYSMILWFFRLLLGSCTAQGKSTEVFLPWAPWPWSHTPVLHCKSQFMLLPHAVLTWAEITDQLAPGHTHPVYIYSYICMNAAGRFFCLVLPAARGLPVNPSLFLTEIVPMLAKEMQVSGLHFFQMKFIMFPSKPHLWEWELRDTINAHTMITGISSRASWY